MFPQIHYVACLEVFSPGPRQAIFLTTVIYYNKESLSSCLEGTFVRNDNIFAVSERFLKLKDRNVS